MHPPRDRQVPRAVHRRGEALRDKIGRLESLRAQFARLRFAVESLSFIYEVPGTHGEDRAYVIRRGRVRLVAAAAQSPADRATLAQRAAEIFAPTERTN